MRIDPDSAIAIKFSRPEFSFGQLVKANNSCQGRITGLCFYPEFGAWVYAIHRLDRRLNEEVWFEADELEAVIDSPHSAQLKQEINNFNLF